jgi:hypothetical protein
MKKRVRREEAPADVKQARGGIASDTSTKGVLEVVQQTRMHFISAMPVIVSYRASIARVRQVDRSGQLAFITDRRVEGKEGLEEQWEDLVVDAYSARDEFFAVHTERQALDFLRNTGEFLPYTSEVSWANFQQWQALAMQVREWSTLSAAHRTWLSDRRPPSVDLQNALHLLAGYPHEYFGPPPPSVSEIDLAELRRTAIINGEHPESLVEAVRKGGALRRSRERALERWFAHPPADSYSIQFIPTEPTAALSQDFQRGGAMLELLVDPDKLRPILVISPRCTLEAIAATIYVDRIVGIRSGKCPGCGDIFEIRNQKTKAYCDNKRCKERVKKQRQRDNGSRYPSTRLDWVKTLSPSAPSLRCVHDRQASDLACASPPRPAPPRRSSRHQRPLSTSAPSRFATAPPVSPTNLLPKIHPPPKLPPHTLKSRPSVTSTRPA